MTTGQCPECGHKLVFAPNGRSRLCERCDYEEAVQKKRPSAAELARAQRYWLDSIAAAGGDRRTVGVRSLLRQGVAAAKAGDEDEAFHYLEWVLRADASEKQRAEAWLWLSQLYDDEADKRECLEQVVAFEPSHGVARRGLALLDGRLRADEIVNPETVRAEHEQKAKAAPAQEANATHFTCPHCSSRMNYTPDDEMLVCEFCGHRQTLDEARADSAQAGYGIGGLEQDFIAALATAQGHVQPVATRSLQCQACAVTFMLAPETISLTCPYCDSVYVTEAAETRAIVPPHALIPFATDEDRAARALKRWLRRHDAAAVRRSPIVGLYYPVWTFDLGGEIKWSGYVRRGDDWLHKTGSGYVMEDDRLVPAVEKAPKPLRQAVDDFDLAQLVAYDDRYLADWPGERYQIPLADASLRARRQVLRRLRRHSYKITGGERVRDLALNSTGLTVLSYKLILLPLWITRYRIEGETIEVYVNGRNGRVYAPDPRGFFAKFLSWLKGG